MSGSGARIGLARNTIQIPPNRIQKGQKGENTKGCAAARGTAFGTAPAVLTAAATDPASGSTLSDFAASSRVDPGILVSVLLLF